MHKNFPVLETDRLLLRAFTAGDIHHVFQGLSDPSVIEYYGVSFTTLEATQAQMQWFKMLEETGKGIWWAICTKNKHEFVGAVGLYHLSREHRKGELGFWLLPAYWRQGIMREAIPFVCHYGFQTLQLHRIEAFVESKNKGSKSTLEKLGFAHEGTMKDCEIKKGEFISLDIYASFTPGREQSNEH